MAIPVQNFIDRLTAQHRVVILGGVAVIAHGYSRHTKDADIWLEPLCSAEDWANVVWLVCQEFEGTTVHRLPGWTEVSALEIGVAVEETGMIRIHGLNCPLDIFRRPNEFDELAFDEVADRARRNSDGSLLPSPLDLIQSKLDTGRDQDLKDIQHLESVVRAEYKTRLPLATLEEAQKMLGRYSEWQVLVAALENPASEVRELAMTHLREFAAAGDPFSLALIEGRELP
jgi:hypothetical protein